MSDIQIISDECVVIKNAISKDLLSPRDRLGLQGDYYALVKAGYTSVDHFLDLATAYTNESDASVLSDLAAGLRGIENLISTNWSSRQSTLIFREISNLMSNSNLGTNTCDDLAEDVIATSITFVRAIGEYRAGKIPNSTCEG